MFFILKPHSLEFATGVDNNLLGGGARFVSTFLHFTYHVCAADDMAKDHVFVIQPVSPVKYIEYYHLSSYTFGKSLLCGAYKEL